MNITIVGAGYAGLAAGVGFAKRNNTVSLVDIDTWKVEMINQGKTPLHEEGLSSILASVRNNLRASVNIEEVASESDVIFICVQTACKKGGGIDLSHVIRAVTDVGKFLRNQDNYPVVVIKSTVIPGSTEQILIPHLEESSGKKTLKDFGIAVNPEFLREGRALEDFLNPDRTVIGVKDERSGDILSALYKDFSGPILKVDFRTAEMAKYASNIFLAAKISLVNEIGNICKKLGVDVYEVVKVMGFDPRITHHFLEAGIGFGGSCLPKDIDALITASTELGYQPSLLQSVSNVNKEQPLKLVELAEQKVGDLSGKRVAVLGLSFKPGTDDIRQSQALRIINQLVRRGAEVRAYDPVAMENVKSTFDFQIQYVATAKEAVDSSDLVFIATGWNEFSDPSLYQGKKVFDGRRVVDPSTIKDCDYEGVCW